MIPDSKLWKLGDFSKGELVTYSNFEYPFRIMALERGTGRGSRKFGVRGGCLDRGNYGY